MSASGAVCSGDSSGSMRTCGRTATTGNLRCPSFVLLSNLMSSQQKSGTPGCGCVLALLAIAIVVGTTWMHHGRSFVDRSENITLNDLPGISPDALAKRDVTYRIIEPISFYRGENVALFDVEILVPNVSEQRLTFTGDAERFNGFVAELEFLKLNAGRFRIGAGATGAKEGVTSLLTGVWEILKHPIDTAQGVKDGASALAAYAAKAAEGESHPTDDIKGFAEAYYLNTVTEIASDAHFSYQEAATEDARATARAVANWKLSGRALSEAALLLVPFTEIKLAKTTAETAKGMSLAAKAGETLEGIKDYEALLSRGSLFTQSAKIANSLRRLARMETVESKLGEQIIHPLCDPVKLASLGLRGANSRMHKILYHMFVVEKRGGSVAEAVDMALLPGVKGEFYYSQSLTKRQLLDVFKSAKDWGIFEDAANLDRMSRGRSPQIMRGSFAGHFVDVDHIIPIKHAPELGNTIANLRYLPDTQNSSRLATLDQEARRLIEDMAAAGWKPSAELAAKLPIP